MNTAKQPLRFVNIHGERVSTEPLKQAKRAARAQPESYHNGWRVVGIPPGALEEAERQHPITVAEIRSWNERVANEKGLGKAKPVPGPWDAERWLSDAKKRPVRSKPYEIPEAAKLCAEMASKAGWLRVEVVELKKEKEKAA